MPQLFDHAGPPGDSRNTASDVAFHVHNRLGTPEH